MSNDWKPGDRLALKEEHQHHTRARFAVVAPDAKTRNSKGKFRVIFDGGSQPKDSKTYYWTKVS